MAHGLFQACLMGSEDLVSSILRAGRDPLLNTFRQGPLQLSALHAACLSGNVKVVDMLCRSGADPNVRNEVGDTPLHFATCGGYAAVIKMLVLEYGASTDARNVYGDTPLHKATLLTVTLLPVGQISSLYAYETLHTLLILNAKFKANLMGETPLDVACRFKDAAIIDKLLFGRNLITTEGHVRTMRWLLHGGQSSRSVLVRLLSTTNTVNERFRLLVRVLTDARGIGYNITTLTLPHVQHVLDAEQGVLPGGIDALLFAAVYENSVELAKILLSHGASVNCVHDKWSPLHVACSIKSPVMVRLLMEHGARVNAYSKVDSNRVTPLHVATAVGCTETMRLLLQNCAKVNLKETGSGYTAIHEAYRKRREDMILLLLSHGADTNIGDNNESVPADLYIPR